MAITSALKLPLQVSLALAGLRTGTIRVGPSITTGQLDFDAGEITWVYDESFEVAASGTREIDLYDFAGGLTPDGQAIAAANVKIFYALLQAGDNVTGVTLAPSASNGWTPLLGASGTITMKATTAKAAPFLRQEAGGLTVTDASSHLVTFTNLDSSNAADIQLIAAGA